MNSSVDKYLIDGCMRCPLGGTPKCKVHNWTQGLVELRRVVLETGLTEELKWSVPCYTDKGRNIAMIYAFKDYFGLSFFKGSLLKDNGSILEKQGENVQGGRVIKLKDPKRVMELENRIKAYLFEAIEVERAGLEVIFKKTEEFPVPDELEEIFEQDPVFKGAFESLTPGRQRGYLLHFAAPKQSKTRISRIEKWKPEIMHGKGIHDDYAMRTKKK